MKRTIIEKESHTKHNLYKLENDILEVTVSDVGATVMSIKFKHDEKMTDVLIGNDDPLTRLEPGPMFGATLGRCSGRIKDGRVCISGTEYQLTQNNGSNHSHGGKKGFDKKIWNCVSKIGDPSEEKLVLEYVSEDGEEGYPGKLCVRAAFELKDESLVIGYEAESDKDTVVSISNHMYFNLGGEDGKSVEKHVLMLAADEVSVVDENYIADGTHLQVEGTPFDFRKPKEIGRNLKSDFGLLKQFGTYDHNMIFNKKNGDRVAEVFNPENGIRMSIDTDYPCAHFYVTDFGDMHYKGKGGNEYCGFCGFCIEVQYAPNSIVTGETPMPLLKANEKYSHYVAYKFTK